MKLRQEDAFLAEAKSCSPELGRSRKSGMFPSPTEAGPLILLVGSPSSDARDDAFYGKAKSCIRQRVGLDSRIQPPTGADLLIY